MAKEVISSGKVHGAPMRQSTPKMTKSELAKQMQRWIDEDSEEITGTFVNIRHPGQSLSFGFSIYPNQPIETYELMDGEKYRLPRAVVRHLNTGCFYKEYRPASDEFGKPTHGMQQGMLGDGKVVQKDMQIHKKIHRFMFKVAQYGDFDLDLQPSELVEVTATP